MTKMTIALTSPYDLVEAGKQDLKAHLMHLLLIIRQRRPQEAPNAGVTL